MKVCHLGKYYPPAVGGMESHVRTLARAQAERGAEVSVLCVNHEAGPTVTGEDGPVTVTRVQRIAQAAKLDLCPDLPARLAAVDADILHVHVPNPIMILVVLLMRPRGEIVVTYQSDHVRQRIRGVLFRPLENRFYAKVRAILATSPAYAASSPLLRAWKEKVRVLPMGIALAPYLAPTNADREEAERIRASHPAPLWFACGRLVYYKGLENAIAALARIEGTLVVVGQGPERGALEAQARDLGVASRVVFIDHATSLVPYYLAAHAFWFPSNARSEAFGLVQVEAMAAGCPVVNARVPGSGVDWVSQDGKSGLTVAIDDPEALAAAARRLLGETGLRERLAAGARERARAEFDEGVMAERSLSLYRELLAAEPVRAS